MLGIGRARAPGVDMKLSFDDHGGGYPFVLLHAFPLSRAMWKNNVEAIKGSGFRPITPDLRGFGESHNFGDINSMEEMAKDVAELISDLKVEKAVLGGLSMGGYVGFELLRLVPAKVSALILCDTTSAADTDEKRQGRFDMIEMIEAEGPQALVDNMLPKLVGETTKNDRPEVVDQIAAMMGAVDPKAAIAALRGMAARRDNTEILSDLKIPTLLIFGEEDKVTDLSAAEKLNRSIAGSELQLIKEAGHLSNLERPEAFNIAVTTFLNKLEK